MGIRFVDHSSIISVKRADFYPLYDYWQPYDPLSSPPLTGRTCEKAKGLWTAYKSSLLIPIRVSFPPESFDHNISVQIALS